MSSPEVVLLYTGNCIHASDFSSRADQLHSNVCADFNDHVLVVSKLWRRGIWIKFDVRRYELIEPLAYSFGRKDCTDMSGYEER